MNLDTYNACRPLLNSGDMVEFASDTALGKMIMWVTGMKVNHTALVLNLDRYEGLKSRRFLLEALEHGIQLSLLSKRLEQFKGKAYWSRLDKKYNHKRQNISVWAIQQVGTKYDYKSLFANMFSRVNQDAKNFFCSEFYQIALVEAGILQKGKAVRPGEFEQFNIHSDTIEL